ncbi:pilus assembly protein CpaF [Lachnospiraceae bacterium YSD2013]|nr:pilus assembly protein CpaF [Lachnospiraceae bacterium YSD2013]
MSSVTENIKVKACSIVLSKIDFADEMSKEEVLKLIDDVITALPERKELTLEETLMLRKEVYNSIKKYDVIQEYLDDESVTEIMINGTEAIFIEKNGRLIKTDKHFASPEKLEDVIQQMVGECNRTVNEAYPIADARLSTGERVNIVLSPVSLSGSTVTIRRFPKNPITMGRLIEIGSITEEAAAFLKRLVRAKYNIFISGGTGTGKTTFLNALSMYIPLDERIITIEDSAELQLLGAENLVRLETRNKNAEGCTPIDIQSLIKSALRMRPDRIIVGEVRGAEAVDMLQAMNTGHDGSLSTGHGNSSKDMIARLETMVLSGMDIPLYAIRGQIASGIDIMIHLARLRNKRRVVSEISEIEGLKDGEVKLNPLYRFEDGVLKPVGTLLNADKLEATENGL